MSDAAFIEAIAVNPQDEALRLVYADWLEEQGDSRGELIRLEQALHGLPAWDDRVWNARERRRELRVEATGEWLEQLGYQACYRPLFDRPLPEERGHRWRLIHTFIEMWHGEVLTAEAGETEEEIEGAEDYVASALPTAMREFYQQAGRQLRFWSFRDTTATLRGLSIPFYSHLPGIEFRVGVEGARWYLPINTRQPDPPVRSAGDETQASPTFSEFTLFALVYEAVWAGVVRAEPVGPWEQVETLLTAPGFNRCHLTGAIWAGQIQLIEGNDILIAHLPNAPGGILHVAARTEAAYLALPGGLRTLLDNARDRVDEG